MRKLTSILAFLLIISLLFTGCNNFPFPSTTPTEPQTIRQDYEHYGFSFKIAGSVTEEEGNKYGQAAFKTNLGQFVFRKLDIPASSDVQNSHQVAIKFAEDIQLNKANVKVLKNGASFMVYGPETQKDGTNLMYACCFVQVGPSIWLIICAAPANDFNQPAIIETCMSTEFY